MVRDFRDNLGEAVGAEPKDSREKLVRVGDTHMAQLDLRDGDVVMIEDGKRHPSAARCYTISRSGDLGLSSFIFMSPRVHDSLASANGDQVYVRKARTSTATRIVVFQQSIVEHVTFDSEIHDQLRVQLSGEPVCLGELITIPQSSSTPVRLTVRFIIVGQNEDAMVPIWQYYDAAVVTKTTRICFC